MTHECGTCGAKRSGVSGIAHHVKTRHGSFITEYVRVGGPDGTVVWQRDE